MFRLSDGLCYLSTGLTPKVSVGISSKGYLARDIKQGISSKGY
jgi:hypothetical protein